MNNWGNWFLDISHWPHRAWVPFDNGEIVFGVTLIADLPPGDGAVTGVCHPVSQDLVDEWLEIHGEEFNDIRREAVMRNVSQA